jgi:hypothetical protein
MAVLTIELTANNRTKIESLTFYRNLRMVCKVTTSAEHIFNEIFNFSIVL